MWVCMLCRCPYLRVYSVCLYVKCEFGNVFVYLQVRECLFLSYSQSFAAFWLKVYSYFYARNYVDFSELYFSYVGSFYSSIYW